MSAFQQLYLEQESANRIRDAHDFADRERLTRGAGPAHARGHETRWAILCLAAVGLAFKIFLF